MHTVVNWTLGGRRRVIGALLFDMDGTMIDSRRFHMAAWRKLVEQLGLGEREYEIARAGFGQTNRAIFEQWWADGGGPSKDEYTELSERKEGFFRELIKGKQGARPGLKRLLERARRKGIRTAVATSATGSNTGFLLAQMGLQRHFDAVVWSRPGLQSKPHPDFFLEAAHRLAVPPTQCIVFEDSVHGFWAARRAGMGLVAIAERTEDLLRCRLWTPWVYQDFRPVPIAKISRY